MFEKKKVVVLGAGFGGLRTAERIAKNLRRFCLTDRYEIFLVNKGEYQTYTPLLYEIATTSKETANACELLSVATYPIRSLIRSLPITFIAKEVKEIDVEKGLLRFDAIDTLPFEYLVLAPGAEINYFDIPGLPEHAFTLKTFVDAMKIRNAVWTLAMEGRESVRIVIGGAGATGVELAGELKAWCGELEKEFQRCSLEVILIEGTPTVLPGLDTRVVEKAAARLKELNVEILTSEKIASVNKDTVILGSGRALPYDVCVWTGGVKGPALLRELPLELDNRGRVIVNEYMQCKALPKAIVKSRVYGLGDAVCFIDPRTQKPVPGVARAALDQATVVAHNIIEDIRAAEFPDKTFPPKADSPLAKNLKPKTYTPRDFPYVIPIGGKFALTKVGPVLLTGFLGWTLKGLIELNYLLSTMSLFRALTTWAKGLTIFIKNDRLG